MVFNNQNIIITKASGERTLFLPKKLRLSLHRAGASGETIDAIMSEMESQVYEGIPTAAIKYGSCAGLNLLSWDFPKGNSLREQIEASGLYPLTCLTTLTLNEKKHLLDNQIVLCKELCQDPDLLSYTNINKERSKVIMIEAQALCKGANK